MTKKPKIILGFNKEDAIEYGRTERTSLLATFRRVYKIPQSKTVPAIPLADVEKAIEDITKEFEGDKFNVYNYERGFEELIQRLGIQKKERRK